jgi:exopolyphosphatase/guanosine-5'-triphosphate,3'-diphosphate pyrophosphatase
MIQVQVLVKGAEARFYWMAGESPRYGVIDVGSNTIHLLVGEVVGGAVVPVTGEKVSARLGSGVERTGGIEARRLEVGASAIEMFASISALNGAPEPAVLATSAVRDAENGPEFVESVRQRTGLPVRLISGEEEALLGFRGALSAGSWAGISWETPALVVDLGGGSAQLILGDAGSGPTDRVSLKLGTNRITERYVEHDPPNPEELSAVREGVLGALPDWEIPDDAPIVAVGGSARAMVKITRDELTPERLRDLAEEISDRPSGVLAREQGLAPERARVLPAAAETLAAISDHFGRESLAVVRGGLREGTVLTMSEELGGVEQMGQNGTRIGEGS